jgi:hypothetical protein
MVPPYHNIKEIGNIARTNGERPHWTTPYICAYLTPPPPPRFRISNEIPAKLHHGIVLKTVLLLN